MVRKIWLGRRTIWADGVKQQGLKMNTSSVYAKDNQRNIGFSNC